MEVTNFKDDQLELIEFAERLNCFIEVEKDFVEGSLVIALSAKFGSGKTSFLNMWSNSLIHNPKKEKLLIVYLNAWESDYFGDPLFAIISALSNSLNKKGKSTENLLAAAKDFGWFATAIGGQIVKKATGIDPVVAGKFAKDKKGEKGEQINALPNTFSTYEGRKNAMDRLKSAIQECIVTNTSEVLFLVDELDRCRPDYAISYLETIKHIFNIKGAVFLLAADRKQLENSARSAFGLDLDFEEYYRKFIHREVSLPAISKQGYTNLASSYVKYYLEREDKRSCFMEINPTGIQNISDLISAFKLTPRQIQEVFRTLGHVFSTTEEKQGKMLWCLAVGTIFMATTKIGAPEIFEPLGHQNLEPQEASIFLKSLFSEREYEWWFTLLLTGGGLNNPEKQKPGDIMKNVGLWKDDEELNTPRIFNDWYRGWGSNHNKFKQIREMIEQVSSWS
jgi:hypothetical protein